MKRSRGSEYLTATEKQGVRCPSFEKGILDQSQMLTRDKALIHRLQALNVVNTGFKSAWCRKKAKGNRLRAEECEGESGPRASYHGGRLERIQREGEAVTALFKVDSRENGGLSPLFPHKGEVADCAGSSSRCISIPTIAKSWMR
jgi:hypothetical protein